MTMPTVTETTLPPEPVAHDPFIDDMAKVVLTPPAPVIRRRRIWD